MIRILIADDHAIMREGLKKILLSEYPFAVFEEAGDAEELVNKAMKGNWDLIISDMTMPGRSGLDALRQIKNEFPLIPFLILSMHSEDRYAIRALRAGA
ncbi:MAG: response regulator transcription factor [Bacteroidota bacterium]